MAKGKTSDRRRKKKKERERRIARERNLRRNAPAEIEDLPASEVGEEDDDGSLVELPSFDTERVFRHLARICTEAPATHQVLQEAIERARGRRVADLVAEISPDAFEDRAQELAFQAMEAEESESALRLAEAALQIDPDCADALCLIASQRERTEDRLAGLVDAVSAAERVLSRPTHRAAEGQELYVDIYRRPYERARTELAFSLCEAGRRAEAAVHLRALIDLHPSDPERLRYALLAILLERGDINAAREVLDRFTSDCSAFMLWARVLERFLSGDRAGACRVLRRARKASREVTEVMLGGKDLLEVDDEQETRSSVVLLIRAWFPHREARTWMRKGGAATTAGDRRAALSSYSQPVAAYLKAGVPDFGGAWRDARREVLGMEHAPELIRMATDPALHESASQSSEVWAPVHAWRELARMGALEAIPPLAALLRERFDDEWVIEDLTWAFIELGPPSLGAMMELIADPGEDDDARGVAAEVMRGIAGEHPECRAEVVAELVGVLEKWEENSSYLNASLVADLVMLGARDAGPLIREVYDEGALDEDLAGTWEHVQADLELGPDGSPR